MRPARSDRSCSRSDGLSPGAVGEAEQNLKGNCCSRRLPVAAAGHGWVESTSRQVTLSTIEAREREEETGRGKLGGAATVILLGGRLCRWELRRPHCCQCQSQC